MLGDDHANATQHVSPSSSDTCQHSRRLALQLALHERSICAAFQRVRPDGTRKSSAQTNAKAIQSVRCTNAAGTNHQRSNPLFES